MEEIQSVFKGLSFQQIFATNQYDTPLPFVTLDIVFQETRMVGVVMNLYKFTYGINIVKYFTIY